MTPSAMRATRRAEPLRAPFPWFGGKSRAASAIWDRIGPVSNYVEPFAGSLAVLLGRPHEPHIETVNDADGFICNAWRSIAAAPDETAEYATWPVNENDLHSRHAWLVGKRTELTARLEGDPDYYDAKMAGWWLWGIACWIGSGWCSGNGPWSVVGGKLVHLGNAGRGVNRKLVHLGNAGRGVNRQLVHLGTAGQGVNRKLVGIVAWMRELSDRLSRVRVCCGDWSRVTGPSVTTKLGLTGIVLDPPYSVEERDGRGLYSTDAPGLSDEVRAWAIEHGADPMLRIVLCGYDTEHAMPSGWTSVGWKASGGFGCQGSGRGRVNASRETLWFSPHCLGTAQKELLA